MKTTTVLGLSLSYIHEPLQEFITKLTKALGKIPIEYRDSADISINGYHGYDNDIALEVIVSYKRPLTQEEIEKQNTLIKKLKEQEINNLQSRLKQLQQED